MRLALLLLLAACAAPPYQTRTETIPNPAPEILRNCATITPRCTGMTALSTALPSLCQNQVCYFQGRSEVLGAAAMPGGDFCGYRAVRSGPQPFAIIGIWGRQADGTRLYRKARFLDSAAQTTIQTSATFQTACKAL